MFFRLINQTKYRAENKGDNLTKKKKTENEMNSKCGGEYLCDGIGLYFAKMNIFRRPLNNQNSIFP